MPLYTSFIAYIATGAVVVSSFVHPVPSSRLAHTRLNLENHIADMIDKELERLQHIDQWRIQQAEKLNKLKEPALPTGFDFNSPDNLLGQAADAASKIQMRKDRRMARDDPARYCADRCVATGNCQVWEDMFNLAADEVQAFCKECVLSEDEEPCNVPEMFIENAGKNAWEWEVARS